MTNVVGFDGKSSHLSGEPNADAIRLAQKLLDDAKSGSIQHIACVWLSSSNLIGMQGTPAASTAALSIVGGLQMLGGRMCRNLEIGATVLKDTTNE